MAMAKSVVVVNCVNISMGVMVLFLSVGCRGKDNNNLVFRGNYRLLVSATADEGLYGIHGARKLSINIPSVSISQLRSRPDRYNNRMVRLCEYGTIGGEMSILYESIPNMLAWRKGDHSGVCLYSNYKMIQHDILDADQFADIGPLIIGVSGTMSILNDGGISIDVYGISIWKEQERL